MRCPKCQHEQHNSYECAACGIIFEKYRQAQERNKAREAAAQAVGRRRLGRFLPPLLLVLVVAGATYALTRYFLADELAGKASSPLTSPVGSSAAANAAPAQAAPVAPAASPVARQVAGPPLPAAESAPLSGANAIDRARRATVSIVTPWGAGSGFFINRHYLVTNRHVVDIDPVKVEELRRVVEEGRQLVDTTKKKITQLQQDYSRVAVGPDKDIIAININHLTGVLKKILEQHVENQRRLQLLTGSYQPSDFKIVFTDGSEHVANFILLSDNHDLALMSLFSGEWDYLEKAPANLPLRQGDRVYTVGSPVGLRDTVTSGVFSGSRRLGEGSPTFLQTDAAINPGNSGGPLIDERGYVHGVNTLVLRGGSRAQAVSTPIEGIGFAIPIETVFEEFSATLY